MSNPWGVAIDASENGYIVDTYNFAIRMVSASTGIMTTVAGTGSQGYSGGGDAATSASFNYPYGVAVGTSGMLYIADSGNNRMCKSFEKFECKLLKRLLSGNKLLIQIIVHFRRSRSLEQNHE